MIFPNRFYLACLSPQFQLSHKVDDAEIASLWNEMLIITVLMNWKT